MRSDHIFPKGGCASSGVGTPRRQTRRQTGRITPLKLVLLLILSLLLALVAGAAWLLKTEAGAGFVLRNFAPGVQAEQLEGSLLGPLRAGRLVIDQKDQRVILQDARIDWDPARLWDRELHIRSLTAARVDVVMLPKENPEPAKLPESIDLPVTVKLESLKVQHGTLSRGPVELAAFGPLDAGFDYDGKRYQLRLNQLVAGSPGKSEDVRAKLNGELTVGTQKPYELRGKFFSDVAGQLNEQSLQGNGELTLGGSLQTTSASIQFKTGNAIANGSALLFPFSPQVLGNADLVAENLDLRHFGGKLPHTALHLDLKAAADGKGTLVLTNRDAGTLADEKLPLRALSLSFNQQQDAIRIESLSAEPGTRKGSAGKIQGSGQLAGGRADFHLETQGLDLSQLDPAWRKTALAGKLDLRQAQGKQEIDLALREPFGSQQIELATQLTLAGSDITVTKAVARAGQGRLEASASASLSGDQPFRAQGRMTGFHLQDFGKFPDWPELLLNGDFDLKGRRAPKLESDLRFRIVDSRLGGQPLDGKGAVSLRNDTLNVSDLALISGTNRLNVNGSLSDASSELNFVIAANQLAQLGPQFSGNLQAKGTVRGTLAAPNIVAEWSAAKVRMPANIKADTLQGNANVTLDRSKAIPLQAGRIELDGSNIAWQDNRLSTASLRMQYAPRPESPLMIALRIAGIETPQLRARKLDMDARGTTGQHDIDIALDEQNQTWRASAKGSLMRGDTQPQWKGDITRFDGDGRFRTRLVSPASLAADAQRVHLQRFILDAPGSRIAVDEFLRDASGIRTRGHADNIQVVELLRQLQPQAPVRTDLQLSAEWDLVMQDTVNGRLSIRRERGDVSVLGGSTVALGLTTLTASAKASDGKLELDINAEGSRLGRIQFTGTGATGRGSEKLTIPENAPIAGNARVELPSIAWIAPLVSPALVANGRIRSDMTVSGTKAAPRLSGSVEGANLRVVMSELGIDLRQGVLQGDFQDDRLVLKQLAFNGGEGSIAVSGPIEFGASPAAQLQLVARRFSAVNRSDRRVIISGNSDISLKEKKVSVTGAFDVDEGFIDLGSADKPRLSEDVVIEGAPRKEPPKTAAAVDVMVGLGPGIKLTGRGMDGTLVGKLRVTGDPGENLQANGTLTIERGTFSAYGRELKIEQGVLRFAGPVGNPSLDILAMRRGQEVEAGVSVRGNVLSPRVSLVSEPAVPEAEKLSWLVLGRPLSNAGEGDVGALQSAAGTLLSKGAAAGVESRLASAFGLDTFSVGKSADNLQQRIITIGKQINSRLYVSYQQGLENAGSVVQLRFTLSPRLSLEAEAGARSALSIFYNIAFD